MDHLADLCDNRFHINTPKSFFLQFFSFFFKIKMSTSIPNVKDVEGYDIGELIDYLKTKVSNLDKGISLSFVIRTWMVTPF